jgi:hypothetical protein
MGFLAMGQAQQDPIFFIKAVAPLNGKTGDEVIELAADKVAERKQRQLSAIEQEMATLKTEVATLQEAASIQKDKLGAIAITGARFYRQESTFMKQGIIAFDIKNNGKIPIRAFYTNAILETPGRAVPWKEDSVNYEVPGEIETGEQKSLKLLAGYGWDGQEYVDRKDLMLTITLRDFSGPDGKRVIGTSDSDIDRMTKRLEELEKQRAALLAPTTN